MVDLFHNLCHGLTEFQPAYFFQTQQNTEDWHFFCVTSWCHQQLDYKASNGRVTNELKRIWKLSRPHWEEKHKKPWSKDSKCSGQGWNEPRALVLSQPPWLQHACKDSWIRRIIKQIFYNILPLVDEVFHQRYQVADGKFDF